MQNLEQIPNTNPILKVNSRKRERIDGVQKVENKNLFNLNQKIFFLCSLVFILGFGFYFQTEAATYNPPIGIPAPPFGIDETVESVYGSADYYTYYVDNTHPAATDTNNSFGSPQKPRLTVPRYLSAGDVVQIHGGPYNPNGRFYFNGQGTQERPIFITGANAVEKPVFNKFVHFSDAQWVIFENIKFENTSVAFDIRPLSNGVEIHHVSIRNCEVAGTGGFKSGSAFGVTNSSYDMPISYIVFYNNLNYDSGQWNAATEDDSHSFAIGSMINHIWIVDNVAYRSGGDGVQVSHGANFTTDHVYIGRNIFYQHRENGVDLKQANDVIVSQNVIYNHRPNSSSPGQGIGVHYNPQRIWLLYNKVYDCEIGITINGASDVYIIGNIIYNIHHSLINYDPKSAYSAGAAIHFRESNGVYIVNNTIFDYDTGIQNPSSNQGNIINNIFSNRAELDGYEILYPNAVAASISQMDYNLFHPVIGPIRIGWGSSSSLNLTEFKSAFLPKGGNSQEGDPLLVNPPADFKIQTESLAKDTGRLYSSYEQFFNTYGISIAKDIVGLSRPQGSAWDIGAYEYSSVATPVSSDTTPPTLSAGSPTGNLPANTTQTTLLLTTNENAICKYGTTPNTAYNSIVNTFTTTVGLTHSQIITGLTNGATYNYYIRCEDTLNNSNTADYPIAFSVNTPQIKASDLNQDQKVNSLDFEILKLDWSRTDKPKSDINQDGVVNTQDLGIMMGEWGG